MFMIYFSPIDGPAAKFQPLSAEEAQVAMNKLSKQCGGDMDEAWKVYLVDADAWVCIAPTLQQAQARLMSIWLTYLVVRFEDDGGWFDVGEHVVDQFYIGLQQQFHKGCCTLLQHMEADDQLAEYILDGL